MILYENVVIGNFLFGFGAGYGYAHKRSATPPICVNLVQQTPHDRRLGDVLIESAAFVRVLEFKRPENKSTKEETKLFQLRSALNGEPDLINLSRRIHWYVEMGNNLQSRIVPYIDFDQPLTPAITLEQLLTNSVNDALRGSNAHEMELCRIYLNVLMSCVGSSGTSAGALIMVITDNGTVMYAALGEIADLRLERRELMVQTAERVRQQEHHLKRTLERSMERSGPSMG